MLCSTRVSFICNRLQRVLPPVLYPFFPRPNSQPHQQSRGETKREEEISHIDESTQPITELGRLELGGKKSTLSCSCRWGAQQGLVASAFTPSLPQKVTLALVGDLCWAGSWRNYESVIKQIRNWLRLHELEEVWLIQHLTGQSSVKGVSAGNSRHSRGFKDPFFYPALSVPAFHTGSLEPESSLCKSMKRGRGLGHEST